MRVNSIVKQNLQSDFKSWEAYQSILFKSNLNGFLTVNGQQMLIGCLKNQRNELL